MDINYELMTIGEIVAYYKRVREYIEQGFRVDGLKDELRLISKVLTVKKAEICNKELEEYLVEIEKYLKNMRY